MENHQFFSNLPIHHVTLSELLGDASHFTAVPAGWHVIVTDIKNSTQAYQAGRSEEINLIATGCIIAVLNIALEQGVEVPFFFGGDGATLIVPSSLLDQSLAALMVHRENTKFNFGLDLRVGSVSVDKLHTEGHQLNLSRLHINEVFSIPVVLGGGLAVAENIIKGDDGTKGQEQVETAELNLDGMECRWDKIKPATTAHEVVCLLVTVADHVQQGPAFKQVIDLIDDIYGPFPIRNPVMRSKLKMRGNLGKIALEMKARLGKKHFGYLLKNWLITLFGKYLYFRGAEGQYYIEKLVQLTDTLVIDGRINTVIAGTRVQRLQLQAALDTLEEAGTIYYGLFVSRESIMSCYVRDRKDQHIHFVDGADGGYTLAAKMLKEKLASAE